MYKRIILMSISVFVLSGCTESLNTVNDVITKTGNILGIKNTNIVNSGNYTVKPERIHPVTIKKTNRNYGQISISKYEKNPDNKTMLYINQCIHPQIHCIRSGIALWDIILHCGHFSIALIRF